MAQQPRKDRQARSESRAKPPISKHPLFPAVVALWFGALFGLGSIAIRASLIESLVISSRLDTLVPAAAPPLGLTARILIAAIMAVLGAVLGAYIARRISRDKPVDHVRRRGAERAHVADDAADAVQAEARQGPAKRRRGLALAEEDSDLSAYEAAPLPGGGINILDVNSVDFAEPVTAPPLPVVAQEVPMELTDLAEPINEAPPVPEFTLPAAEMIVEDDSLAHAARAFDRPAVEAGPVHVEPVQNGAQFRPAAMDLQQFQPAPAPRFSAPVAAPDAAIAEPVEDALSGRNAAFAAAMSGEVASPIQFNPPVNPPVEAINLQEEAGLNPVVEVAESPIVAAPVFSPAPAFEGAPFPTSLEPADRTRIASAELDTLSPVELAERLAMSIQNRRKAQLAASTAAVAAAASALPEPPMAPSASFDAPRFDIPSAYVAQVDPVAPAPAVAPGLPAGLRPLSLEIDDEPEGFDNLPPRHIAMTPAPVAPIADQVTDAVSTRPAESRFSAPFAASFGGGFAESAQDQAAEDAEAEEVREDSYSSLLDIARPAEVRAGFVRIEEPEDKSAVAEPVVIFPSQASLASAPATAMPRSDAPVAAPDGGQGDGAVRRFDSPSAVSSGAPSFVAGAVPQQDPAATEQALRSALANLQRMSGAA